MREIRWIPVWLIPTGFSQTIPVTLYFGGLSFICEGFPTTHVARSTDTERR